MSRIKNLSIDIETYSSENLARCGVYRYVESPDFEIILFGYSTDGDKVRVIDLASGEKLPDEIREALTDSAVTKWAFNAQFERVCLSRYLGLPTGEYLDPSQWRCSMIWSAYMGLPLSLQGVGAVLGLEKQKMEEGKDLIRYFCVPCKPTKTNRERTRNLPADSPDKWSVFKEYNKRDVETEMAIKNRLSKFPVPDFVWDEYHLDQEINDRGIMVDMPFVREAIRIDGISREKLITDMKGLTELENPNSVAQMKEWLSERGLEVESLGKKDVKTLLSDTEGEVNEALSLRLQVSKTSVKKYQAMEDAVCADDRARGMFQFYGANRTGRFSGRIIQLQNCKRNEMPDLDEARELIRSGDIEALSFLYDDIPDVLSQLIRTAFIPMSGKMFYVADFSAIEARVLAWLAGEQWVLDVFASGGDIYCETASRMFGVPVVKHGINGDLRQKGKQATLSCIAEGQFVLTGRGLVPIEEVKLTDKLWDGEEWVEHEGVIYKGEREVITYEGLTATEGHLVWVEGKSGPIHFGIAATSGAHLVQTGDGGKAIRLGQNHQSGEEMERKLESLLCIDRVPGMQICAVAESGQPQKRKIKGMPELFSAETDSSMVGPSAYSSEKTMRKPERSSVSQLWGEGNKVQVSECNSSGTVSDKDVRHSGQNNGVGQDRHERRLCFGKYSILLKDRKFQKQKSFNFDSIRTSVLAVLRKRGCKEIISRSDKERNNRRCSESCTGKKEKLASHRGKVRVYDIQNAGRHNRFTVSGHLVHNCGYGGGVGALKNMGAIEAGMKEEELQPLVDAWRTANPNIVKLWWNVDRAVKKAVKEKTVQSVNGIRFACSSGMLFITLPSGRNLCYVKPRIEENRFGGDGVTYEGIGATKKWERIESFGGRWVENVIQGIARDILLNSMKTLRNMRIVAHVHDELIIEADPETSLEEICRQMAIAPEWAEGLILRADGYKCEFYKKD